MLIVAIGRVIESMLFGVSPRDLMTYVAVIRMIVAGALAACLFTARVVRRRSTLP